MMAKGWDKLTVQAWIIWPALEPGAGSGRVSCTKLHVQNGDEEEPARRDWGSVYPKAKQKHGGCGR